MAALGGLRTTARETKTLWGVVGSVQQGPGTQVWPAHGCCSVDISRRFRKQTVSYLFILEDFNGVYMLHHIWYRDCVKHVSYVETGNKCLANDVILSRKVRPGNSLSVTLCSSIVPASSRPTSFLYFCLVCCSSKRILTLVPFLWSNAWQEAR